VSRLFLGEFGHAMPMSDPHENASEVSAGAASVAALDHGSAQCGGHDSIKKSEPQAAPAPAPDVLSSGEGHATHDTDCCQSTLCACACAHVSPMSIVATMIDDFVPASRTASATAQAAPTKRPPGIFRPPA
jgi:hypothetical protein